MRKRKIVFSKETISDIDGIWLYTLETWSVKQADRYFQLIMNEIDFLAQQPDSGRNLNDLRKGYYSSKVKFHFIFYKFSESEIEIIRILHESMDIPNRL